MPKNAINQEICSEWPLRAGDWRLGSNCDQPFHIWLLGKDKKMHGRRNVIFQAPSFQTNRATHMLILLSAKVVDRATWRWSGCHSQGEGQQISALRKQRTR